MELSADSIYSIWAVPISPPAYLNLSKVNPPVPKSGSRRERYASDHDAYTRVFVDYIAEEFSLPSSCSVRVGLVSAHIGCVLIQCLVLVRVMLKWGMVLMSV